MLEKIAKRFKTGQLGSALIMTVVLTVLLAIVAVMFVAVARMDMAATSNIADNKMLDSAAKSIIAIINNQLVLDTPGVATPSQEYYDYPDANNAWLASLEPYESGGNYYWRQISDVTNYLHQHSYSTINVDTDPPGSTVIKDYPEIKLKLDGTIQDNDTWADADGDGIADSKWFELADLRTSKGNPIYAAVRVIDNSAMVNINTAHSFDANSNNETRIDGSTQMQINLAGLLKTGDTITTLHNSRCGGGAADWNNYIQNVIWRYGPVYGNYLPFDISDELELRYRYCIDGRIISRFEVEMPDTAEGAGNRNFGNLYDGDVSSQPNDPCFSNWRLEDWQRRITEPNDPKADRRHLLTTLNLDRIIDPAGNKMININDANVNALYSSICRGLLDANPSYDVNGVAAQLAVNIIDYRDTDSDVNYFDLGTERYYGFERPCVYISELAYRGDGNTPGKNSYAVELYKPYSADSIPDNRWKLFIDGTQYNINWNSDANSYHVIKWEDSDVRLNIEPNASIQDETYTSAFNEGSEISLTREVGGDNIVVDFISVPSSWMTPDGGFHSIQRDNTPAKCIRRLWDLTDREATLGKDNTFINGDPCFIQAHPKNDLFTNSGEIGMILRKAAYYPLTGGDSNDVIGYNGLDTELQVRLNLADSDFQQIFKYLTVIDHPTNAAETRVKGRININTAPAYVIAQLPWVSLRESDYNDANLAKAIVAYRDKQNLSGGGPDYRGPDPCGFGSIGQLCDVVDGNPNFGIDYYSRGVMTGDQAGFPDLTPPSPTRTGDGAADDFEERDLIFARISDLVTVRSDIFTAYILVRIGTDGPQKRVITILDRSGVTTANDKPVIRAFQLTPEAR